MTICLPIHCRNSRRRRWWRR